MNEGSKTFDPFEPWRELRDNSMDAWAKTMIEYVNSDAYAKTTGVMLQNYLIASEPFRQLLEKTMVRALEQLGMPTRADFVSLAQRLTNIEMRIDDMDAKLDRIEALRQPPNSSPAREKKDK
jgi:hypothetical protein